MIPSQASTQILNNLVKAYNQTVKCLEVSQSIENYCLSYDDENKPLKLNYGLSKIDSNLTFLNLNCVNFGKGIGKITENLGYTEFPNQNDNQFGFKIDDIYQYVEDLNNCYILGALYLTIDESDVDFNFVTAKYTNDSNGVDVVFSKDISLSTVEEILKYNDNIYFPNPTLAENESIIIYKYIIDIETLTNDRKTDRFFIYFYDFRTPEGLFGLSEETIYNNLITGVINGNQQINALRNVELNNIKNVIQKWMDLDGWVANFENYWTLPENELPEELRTFINFEMELLI